VKTDAHTAIILTAPGKDVHITWGELRYADVGTEWVAAGDEDRICRAKLVYRHRLGQEAQLMVTRQSGGHPAKSVLLNFSLHRCAIIIG